MRKLLLLSLFLCGVTFAQYSPANYCADSGASDTYACNLSPSPIAYVTGTTYFFKANTANTGAATINFNGIGAITIVKVAGGVTTTLSDNDIRIGQIVELTYDGTNMQMQSTLGNGAPSAYNTIQNNGTPLTQRTTLNCTGNATCSDSGGITVLNVAGGGGATGNSITSVTPVTVSANTTSDQKLMELALTAGFLNSLGQPFQFNGAGVYTTTVAQTPTLTFKIKLCTVSGCGSGTVVTLVSIVSTATIASVTNNNWNYLVTGYTAATGATGNLEIHGPLSVDLGALTTTADSIFNDTNVAVSGNIDLTAALFVDFTVATSSGSASNSITQRQGGVMPFAATAAPVTSVNTQTGAVTLFSTNAQTGTYQVLASDFTGCKTIYVSSGTFTITLVASGSQPTSGQCITVINYGTGVVTLARSGQNINGAASNLTGVAGSATAPTGWYVVSDGANYIANVYGSGASGANPAGSASEINSRLNGTTFQAVTGTSTIPLTGWTRVNGALLNNFSANQIVVSIANDSSASTNYRLATRSVPDATFTIIVKMECQLFQNTNSNVCGVYLTDGTKLEGMESVAQAGVLGTRFITTTNVTTTPTVTTATTTPAETDQVVKIVEDGVHTTWSYWENGAFVQFVQRNTHTFLTPSTVGTGGLGVISGAVVNIINRLTYYCYAASSTTCNGF